MTDEPRTDETSEAEATADPTETAGAEGNVETATETVTEEATEPAEDEASADEEEGEEKPKRLDQSVEFMDVGPCKKHVLVTIQRQDIEAKLNEKYGELITDANVRGFRPGKAPRKVVEKRYAKDVSEQVRGELLLQSLEQLAEEHDIAPLSAPDIDPSKVEIPKEGPMVYEFEVEIRPQFDLPEYKGLKLTRPTKTFTDEDVDREQRRLLEQYGQIVPKEPAAGASEPTVDVGDTITADAAIRDGDREIRELQEVRLRVQPKLAFQDGVAESFAKQMKGARAGESRVVDIKLSDVVADASLAGKTVQATFDIKDIKTIRLPEITHELCHEFGVHSEEQLRELIRVALNRRLEYEQRQSARQQVLERITAAENWELPNDLLARQARSTMNRRIMEMQNAGMSDEDIRARMRLLQQDSLRSTAQSLKEHFVLQKIAEVEKIEIEEDDIEQEIERIADRTDEAPRRIRARLQRDDLLDTLAVELTERKALDLILDSAEYDDVAMDEAEDEPAVATVEAQASPEAPEEPPSPEAPEAAS